MDAHQVFGLVQVVVVMALVVTAAVLATPKGRLPLALRGLANLLRRDSGAAVPRETKAVVPVRKRLLAFLLVVLAFLLASVVV